MARTIGLTVKSKKAEKPKPAANPAPEKKKAEKPETSKQAE